MSIRIPHTKKSSRELEREQRQRNEERAQLESSGWKSTGDMPYVIGHALQMNPARFAAYLARILQDVLQTARDIDPAVHIKRVGPRTYLSPELRARLVERSRIFAAKNRGKLTDWEF